MTAELSSIRKAIYIAYEKGYRVTDDGVLVGLKGKPLTVRKRGKQRYPTFSVKVGENTGSGVFGIPTHRFAGYCFYGDKIFDADLCIRHLDANTENISKENLVLGTYSENEHDKSREDRIRVAKIARAAQGRAMNSKFTDEQVREIRKRASDGETGADIARDLGVTRNCIYLIIKRRNYPNVI